MVPWSRTTYQFSETDMACGRDVWSEITQRKPNGAKQETEAVTEAWRPSAKAHRHVAAREEVVGGQLEVELVLVALEGGGVCGRDEVAGGGAQLREEEAAFGVGGGGGG